MTKLRGALYCLIGGLSVTLSALSTPGFWWWWLSGIVLAASFVPVALFGPRRGLSQFGVVVPVLLIVRVVCTWSEALIFLPVGWQHLLHALPGVLVIQLIVAAVLAALAAILKLPREAGASVVLRSAGKLVLMVAVCGVAYLLYYFVFGGITYQFFTKVYYGQATQQVMRLGLWFPAIQFGRGALMTLAVLPVIRTLRLSRGKAAIAVGVLIWVVGGVAPLLAPDVHMGATQRFIHTIEILTQNGSLGITAVLLLRRRPALQGAELPVTTPGRP